METLAAFCVYALVNVMDGDKRYVGATDDLMRRWRCHKWDARHGKRPIARAIREFGIGAFNREVLEWCETQEDALKAEVFWIEWYESFGPNGYNMCKGGLGLAGWSPSTEWREKSSKRGSLRKHSDSERRKISEGQLRRPPITDETRAKLSANMKARSDQIAMMNRNRVWSEESRRKIAVANKSRSPVSLEIRAKMSEAQKGKIVSDETKRRMSASMRRSSHARILTFNGESLCLTEWAERIGVSQLTLTKRLIRGWSVEKTLTTPTVQRG